jgi:hypothetical protein
MFLMLVLQFYAGLCIAFQFHWEFWYLDNLSASPLIIAASCRFSQTDFSSDVCISIKSFDTKDW